MSVPVCFHRPQLEDAENIMELLKRSRIRCCDHNFAALYGWQDTFDTEIAVTEGCLAASFSNKPWGRRYLFPLGEENAAISVIDRLIRENDAVVRPLTFVCVTEEQKILLKTHFPGQFSFEEERSCADYVYDIDIMAQMSGRHLSGKRNHIRHFLEEYRDWQIEEISQNNIQECIAMENGWKNREMHADGEFLAGDTKAFIRCIEAMDELHMEGILLRVEGKIAALALGSVIYGSDTFDLGFEKARGDIRGAYPMIAREMARYIKEKHPEIRYINREDDMDVEGLRLSKLSYHPAELIKKYTVTHLASDPCIEFRKACEDDMAQIKALWQDTFNDADDDIDLFFSGMISCSDMTVAVSDGRIVGQYALIPAVCTVCDGEGTVREDECLYLYAFAVMEDLRGRGIGRLMLDRMPDFAEGKRAVYTWPAGEGLTAFYRSCGFRNIMGFKAGKSISDDIEAADVPFYLKERSRVLDRLIVKYAPAGYLTVNESFYETFVRAGGTMAVSGEFIQAFSQADGIRVYEEIIGRSSDIKLRNAGMVRELPGPPVPDIIHIGIHLE